MPYGYNTNSLGKSFNKLRISCFNNHLLFLENRKSKKLNSISSIELRKSSPPSKKREEYQAQLGKFSRDNEVSTNNKCATSQGKGSCRRNAQCPSKWGKFWRLKSQSLLLNVIDRNTKFFHEQPQASHIKNHAQKATVDNNCKAP